VTAAGESLAALSAGSTRLGLHLTGTQLDQMRQYCDLIVEWNKLINLTGVRDPERIMTELVLDSLTIALALPAGWHGSGAAVSAVDIGSGAGIPGIPLAISFPHWSVSLVESVAKKVRFLEAARAELSLKTLQVVHGRAEEVASRKGVRDHADLCVARAVAPLPTLVELCAPFVRSGGLMVFPKGAGVDDEVDRAAAAARALRSRFERVVPVPAGPGLNPNHALVVFAKLGPTSPGYPRRVGLAGSRPIGSDQGPQEATARGGGSSPSPAP
jgi:16S rRNA (guanine527-N7)-methyltransferase